MSDDDTLLAEIIELTKSHTGKTSITPKTRLYADLGMTGDDAHEFMLAFAVKYEVDLGDLIWLRFFDDEGVDMLGPAMSRVVSMASPSFALHWQAARDAEREITVGHLADVAQAKVWRDPNETLRRTPRSSPLTLIFSTVSLVMMAFFFVLGLFVTYGFLTNALGDRNLLTLFGMAAMSLLVPVFLVYASWQSIQRKLASA